MAKLKTQPHPSGRKGTRNHRFYPQLQGLGNALGRIIESAPSSATVKQPGNMSDPGLEEKLSKQAAKLARRARRAGHPA